MRRFGTSLAVALVLLPWQQLSAQPILEYDLKAAFVYNFALFTEWPADTLSEGGTLNICINPNSALRQPLASMSERSIKGRKIAVRSAATLDDLHGCHVVFVDAADKERWGQIRPGLNTAGMLTISDDEELGHNGAVITLAMEGNRIVFDIDARAARQAKLVLSSKLLRLARTVQ